MITNKLKNYISGGLAALTIYTASGCATVKTLKSELTGFGDALQNPIHEAFRSNEPLNEKPEAVAEGVNYNDYTKEHQYVVVNERGFLKSSDSIPPETLEDIVKTPPTRKYIIPAINASFIEDGQGGVFLTYPCRIPSSDLFKLINYQSPPAPAATPPAATPAAPAAPPSAPTPNQLLPGVDIIEYPGQNKLIFRGKKENFGNNFDRLINILNQFDAPAKQVRVRMRIVEYFNDNTYDREMSLQILRDGMSIFNLNLPSNADPTQPLTTGVTVNPVYNLNKLPEINYLTGVTSVPRLSYKGAISFLDSHGKTQTLADTDMLVSNGSKACFFNTTSIPFPEYVVTPASVIQTSKYRDSGPKVELTPYANEEGFTTIKLTQAASGENTGFLGTLQKPTFRDANLTTEMTLRNGLTYFIGTSLNTRYKSVDRGLPILNKIPFIRDATTSRSIEKNTSELLYFMEVNVMDRDSIAGVQRTE
jgi:hypothetical protein